MRIVRISIALIALFHVCIWNIDAAVAEESSSGFHLRDGDSVVFYGDSITDQRLYTTFVETFVVTRFPQLNVGFVHSGWGGDRVGGGGGGPVDVRLERDVVAYQPTVVTIMLGMNDGGVRAFDQGLFDQYASGYEHIVAQLKKSLPGVRLTLIQPSPYDDVTRPPGFDGGYNAVLVRYGQFVKELAQRENLSVADLNGPVVAALEKAKTIDPELAKSLIPDRVHPERAGHLLMAAELLKAWNAPAIVSAVEIDAATQQVTRSESTKVTQLSAGSTLSWQQADDALPLPIDMSDPTIALAVQSSDLVEKLSQQTLRVRGLPAAKYALTIDQAEIGTFAREELDRGINLAPLPTPMLKQAMAVHDLTLLHTSMHQVRWRNVEVGVGTGNFKTEATRTAAAALLAALDEEEAAVVIQQRAAAQPVVRQYQLSPREK